MTDSTLSNNIHWGDNEREGDGTASIKTDSLQINAEAAGVLSVNLGERIPLENDKEAKRKSKKRGRNHRYYLRHIERLQKKARDRYSLAQEEDETSGEETEGEPEEATEEYLTYESVIIFSVLIGVPVILVLIAFVAEQKQDGKPAITPSPPAEKFQDYDMGGGKIIPIPILPRP